MSELEPPRPPSASVISMERMWLEKWCSTLSKAGVSTKPLIRRLSTFLGACTVARGNLATMRDKLSAGRRRSTSIQLFLIEEILSEISSVENGCFELIQALEGRTGGSSSSPSRDGP